MQRGVVRVDGVGMEGSGRGNNGKGSWEGVKGYGLKEEWGRKKG